MIHCYNCGNELDDLNYCKICNADVYSYKQIVMKSFSLYNEALSAALLRDISRSISLLKGALKIYKGNTNARNLLGLCYYEIGDIMAALREWVISKNVQKEDNLAIEYIEKTQMGKAKIENLNSIIRKFNLALRDAASGRIDVAIIQLKKVVGNSTLRPLRAYQLLSLLYIKNKEYKKAFNLLQKAKEIDRYNPITLSYLKEVENYFKDTNVDRKSSKDRKIKALDNKSNKNVKKHPNGEYFSYVSYKEPSPIVSIISLILGMIIGGLSVWLLILPAREQKISKNYNSEINIMSEKIAVLQSNINNLNDEIDSYKQEARDIKSETQNKLNQAKISKLLLSAFSDMKNKNNSIAKDKLKQIDANILSDDEKILYYDISEIVFEEEIKAIYNEGYADFKNKNYNKAILKFKEALKLNPKNDDALYYLAKAFIEKDEKTSAKEVLEEYLQLLPNGKRYRMVQRDLVKIKTELSLEE